VPADVAHFDLFGPDDAGLQRFYAQALGWEVDAKGPGYALVTTPGDGPNGALVAGERPGLVLGVTVDDIEAAVAAVVEAGGTVDTHPTDNGWVVKALVRDPAGNRLSLIQR
jgi:predicted enzyme related to lactoylglutathione lyase